MSIRTVSRRHRSRADEGFTLLECLIALVVLSIGIMGYMSVHYQRINGRLFSKRMHEAVVAANDRAEETLAADYEDIENLAGSAYFKEGESGVDPSEYDSGAAMANTLTVSQWTHVTGNPNAEIRNMKTLSMTTQWKEKDHVRSTSLHTYVRSGRESTPSGE